MWRRPSGMVRRSRFDCLVTCRAEITPTARMRDQHVGASEALGASLARSAPPKTCSRSSHRRRGWPRRPNSESCSESCPIWIDDSYSRVRLGRERKSGSPKSAGVNLRKTRGGSRHVADQLSELGVRHAAADAVEASRYCGQELLVPLVLPVMQKALPALRGRSRLRPGSIAHHGTYRSIRPGTDAVAEAEHPSQETSIHGARRRSYVTTAASEASSRVA